MTSDPLDSRPADDTTIAAPSSAPAARWLTWRSVTLALAGVCLICGLTPYNDFVVANTFMVGGYLPPVMAVTFLFLVIGVNAPLHRWAPRRALSPGELATIFGVMLVACSVPTQGLMRMLLPQLVVPFRLGADNPAFWSAFTKLDLPDWLYPVGRVDAGLNHPNVAAFYARVLPGEAIPYAAWVVPLAAWGVFVGGMWATLLAMSAIVWRQWASVERLPFPIAQTELALIEPPRPGRALNDLLGSRLFWIAFAAVVAVHLLAGLHQYFPRNVPAVPLSYDLRGILNEPPFAYLANFVKTNTIYFTFIGISYFIAARVTFSLWAILLIREAVIVVAKVRQVEISYGAWEDQYLGAATVLVAWILWAGRRHWAMLARDAVRGGTSAGDGFLSARASIGLFVGGIAVMAGWLIVVGVSPLVVAGLIGTLLVAQLVTARVVAEAGLPFMRFYGRFDQVYTSLPPSAMTGRDVYFAGALEAIGPASTREGIATFATHALQVQAATAPPRRVRGQFMALVGAALVLGYVVAAASSLRQYYTYATPLTPKISAPLNDWAAEAFPRQFVAAPLANHDADRYPPRPHSRAANVAVGATIMTGLYAATVLVPGWPLMPIGYLLCSTGVVQIASFSLFLGWLSKVVLVRLGGAPLFLAARPFYVGLILGEAAAAGLWLVVTLAMSSAGLDYQPINILPN